MPLRRCAGVLLHVSSLPGNFGVGDFGPSAHKFADYLAEAGFSVWQVLPLTPTSPAFGNSPYSSPSAFAGSPLFVSQWFLAFTAFVGANLLQSGLTKWCMLENILRKLGIQPGC